MILSISIDQKVQVTVSNLRIYKILSQLMLFSNFSFKKILKHNKHVAKSHQNKPINQFRSNSTDTSISLVHLEGSRNRRPDSQRHQDNHRRYGRQPDTKVLAPTVGQLGCATGQPHGRRPDLKTTWMWSMSVVVDSDDHECSNSGGQQTCVCARYCC